MSRSTIANTGLLTVIAVLLGVLVTVLIMGPRQWAQAAPAPVAGGGGGDIVVVKGEYDRKPVIWVIDTGNKSMVAYKLNRGSEIYPVSMRAIGPDLELAPALMRDKKNKMGGQVDKIRAGQKEYNPRVLKKTLIQLRDEE